MSQSSLNQQPEKERRSPRQYVGNAVGAVGNVGRLGVKSVSTVFDDFKAFINKGNVVDLAVGLVMGTAFTAVVNSAVTDLFTPIIALAIQTTSLANAFVVMACPKNNVTGTRPSASTCSGNFSTVAQANTAGAITWNYGSFIQQCINFIIIAAVVFFIVKIYSAGSGRFIKPKEKTEKECINCCKSIPCKAKRCAFCTSAVVPIDDPLDEVTEV